MSVKPSYEALKRGLGKNTNAFRSRIFSTSHLMVVFLDKDFNFIRVNRAYAAADGRGAS